jgi:hypothetical protein
MIRKNHDEIWYWHQKIEEFNESGMSPKKYCIEYEVDYKKFCGMRYRIEFTKNTHPEDYKRNVPIARSYIASGAAASKFSKANKIDIKLLTQLATHLRYVDIIEEFKKKQEVKPMQFIQVPSVQGSKPRPPMIQEHELMEKQNDIEINITKGVKVTISPNIDSMKIIKIIELLKDL